MMGPQLWNFNICHLLLLLFLSKLTKLCSISIAAADPAAITPNQSITDGRVLVSPGGKFALGFFRPGASNRCYVGIWYNKVSEQTVVWVANRNNPLNDTSGVVSLNSAGNLILTTAKHNAPPVWSTNISTNSTVPVEARLLDSGNLAVIQEGTEKVLWQSFDYPTDTLMPFMKLGLDKRTGLNRVLTSWKSPDDPGTGSCSYGIDPTGTPQVFLDKGSERRWRAGPWNGQRLNGVPAMTNNYIFNISYVDGPDENFIMYGIMNPSIISRMVLSESGSVERFTWHEADRRWIEFWSAPKDSCEYYRQCGAFGYCNPNPNSGEFECKCLPGFKPKSAQDWYLRDGSGGCVRERGPDSVCGKGEGFVRLARAKVPDTRVARADMGVTGQACEEKCLKNCTCVAYTSANVSGGGSGSGCLAWYGDLVDTQVYSSEGQDLYVRVDAVVLENARKRSKGFHGAKRTLVLTIMPIILVGLILITVRFCWYGRLSWLRGHSRSQSQKMSLLNLASPYKSNVDGNESEGNNGKINLPFYSLREIKSATDNFSNKLGEGGFGAVYKGHLSNGQVIAVKRLAKQSGQGAEEFKNEVLLIAKLQHRNLVKILGYCIDEEETMLIYEYMLNKSLNSFIFDQSRKAMLDWERRYEIIIRIARGILYLHQDSRLRIVHRDLKTSNILLDGEMNPKISDFGMARIFGGNQTQANINRVVGTFGYMSPEYALDGLFSMKSDVFSFGVLLLEIISGTKNLALYTDDPLSNLIRYTWDLWREGKALDVVDASLGDSWPKSDVIRCIHVGLLCVQENAVDRPTMSTVVFTLSNEATLPPPKQPPFAIRRSGKDTVGSTASGSTSCSKNEVTITEIEPR